MTAKTSMIKNKLVDWLNAIGLYTFRQYLAEIERSSSLGTYAHELEKAVNGMSDPSKPIVIFSDNTLVSDVILNHGQQIIVSPSARFARIERVCCLPRATFNKEGGAA